MNVFWRRGTLALSLVMSTQAFANNTCEALFRTLTPQSQAVKNLVAEDAYNQWLLWEQKANLKKFEKPTTTIQIPLVKIGADQANVIATSDAPKNLINLFQNNDGSILWARHPYNTSSLVPFKDSASTSSIPVYMTSSRSLALEGQYRGFTIKLATDHPHGPLGEYQPGKINTNDDVDSALIHTNHLKNIDNTFGSDDKLIILGEVMTVAEKKTGIGMVVRDVRATDDGHYYLPALSIPFVGREIAAINGVPFEEFFEKNYGALLGEAKARLLLRGGLQMLTPNPQNMMIQLDRNLKPTGRIVFRDVSDAYLVDVVAKGLGYQKQIDLDNAVEYPPKTEIKPFWSNSSWRFNEAGDKAVSDSVVTKWGRAHNHAYIEYIKKELGLEIPENTLAAPTDDLSAVYEALKSDIGQKKLAQYRLRMEAAEAQRQAHLQKAAANF